MTVRARRARGTALSREVDSALTHATLRRCSDDHPRLTTAHLAIMPFGRVALLDHVERHVRQIERRLKSILRLTPEAIGDGNEAGLGEACVMDGGVAGIAVDGLDTASQPTGRRVALVERGALVAGVQVDLEARGCVAAA